MRTPMITPASAARDSPPFAWVCESIGDDVGVELLCESGGGLGSWIAPLLGTPDSEAVLLP